MEHEDGALLGGEASKPTFKEVAIAHAQQLVRGRRSVDRQHPQVRRPTALARRLGDADVDEEALEPGIEPIRIAEAAKVTPGDHQRVLQGVLGPIDVTEDPLGDREETVGSDADQVDIRVPIPALCRPHEIVVHGPLASMVSPVWASSNTTGRSEAPVVHSSLGSTARPVRIGTPVP